ncbi:RNA-directed DNA polymerase [Zhihengliuella halotolerans]|uniref:Reverse transcriptase (RNA-dependent DNA polymerase) n=1 Tax=Zhihengliuella halotolerans TaxID=370736 RepID=A0A4Q8AC77_9MICC|nr:RNA-directed DNA polymerase [Zhihengliuella halotolerans]RZU61225.1 reverse transcriptase (RNA-dependent DNA polymerase) [Zhihengliuella halotolerans]
MRDALPTLQDVKRLVFRQQRKKNLIPEHAALTNHFNTAIIKLRESAELATASQKPLIEKELRAKIEEKREAENAFLLKLAEQLEDYIIGQPDRIRLKKHSSVGRQITTLNKGKSIQAVFDRYCAMRLADSFRIRTVGRDQIIRTLIDALEMARGPKNDQPARRAIIRFDIREFYASIPHHLLLDKIESHAGIPSYVNKHVRSILGAYNRVYEVDQGVPQGVPSSAVLSEIFLENFDARLKRDTSVAVYLRYVDDVLIICDAANADHIETTVRSELLSLGLEINSSKFTSVTHPSNIPTFIEYLGYSFRFSKEQSQLESIDIDNKKSTRLRTALDRLEKYADSVDCWASPKAVDFYFLLFEYLLMPHASESDGDSLRIVTGLAYNARFARGRHTLQPNLTGFINTARSYTETRFARFRSSSGSPHVCPCCKQIVHRNQDMTEFAEKFLSTKQIFHSVALPHKSDEDRAAARRVLWN